MMLTLLAAGVTLALLALLIAPLFQPREAAPAEGYDLAVYHDQLAELERDSASGLIGDDEARAARIEIERRILAVADTRAAPAAAATARMRGSTGLAAGLAVVLPVFTAGLYLALGQPSLPDQPLAARDIPEAPPQGSEDVQLASLIEQLHERLDAQPDDPRGWQILGRAEFGRGQPEAAVAAFRRALDLSPRSVEIEMQLSEALVAAADGMVTPEAERRFAGVLDRVPGLSKAKYYQGLVQAQKGELEQAVTLWRQVLADTPDDVAWRPAVVEAVRAAGRDLGRSDAQIANDLPDGPQPSGGGPSAAEVARIQAMPPDEQARAIRGMVDSLAARLEREPDDAMGWLRLAQARTQLGDRERAREAFARALELRPNDPEIVRGAALASLGPDEVRPGLPVIRGNALPLFARWASLAPADPAPLWYQGLGLAQAGEVERARASFEAALKRIPVDRPEADMVRHQIQALQASMPTVDKGVTPP
ncbi:c-type cytochrome biogenesis protein CcmI [Marinivivus vitaminiproducens]|uniref:c-type cytochrome biogenesis protein CcmI n=1 Tax=Marinivivus vitaminiproducens TaxID=3035935 RepID=UPI0027A06448|nr:c-type cytochrome biogenesis protein CcmI [Geminicoccaceae bacterium SCSIO 64248]